MVLSLIPLNNTVGVKQTTLDDWGIKVPAKETKFYRVRVDYDTKEAQLALVNGSEVVITGAVVFAGKVDLSTNDVLVIDGKDFHPMQIKEIKDFGGVTVHTRVLF